MVKKLYEEIAESILKQIKQGKLLPGDKLDSVEQLAINYKVSRSAIREALSGLRGMGVVEIKQGQGTYIARFNPSQLTLPIASAFLMKKKDIKELSEVRKILEVGIARLAAQNRTEEDLIDMQITLESMRKELNAKADLKFHLTLAEATHNELLISLFTSVSDVLIVSMEETKKDLTLYKDHVRIYEAIKQGDESLAETAMTSHLLEIDDVLKRN